MSHNHIVSKWQCQDFNPDAKGLITKYIASVFILSYTIIPSTQKLNIAHASKVNLLKNLWGLSLIIRCPCHSSKEFLKLCKCGAERDSTVQTVVLVALKKSSQSQCMSLHIASQAKVMGGVWMERNSESQITFELGPRPLSVNLFQGKLLGIMFLPKLCLSGCLLFNS